jgi:hypothetical protein
MGTRGAYGFRIDGIDKLTYNHSDSYPDGLGIDFVEEVNRLVKLKTLASKVRKIKLVDENTKPTDEDIANCAPYTNLGVGKQSTDDWYCLLREAQGSLSAALKSGYMLNSGNFIQDSLFCEYAYILNLDTNKVEFYKGFQEKEHDLGRYGHLRVKYDHKPSGFSDYWGCALVGEFPMKKIPKKWMKIFNEDDEESN